MINTDRTVHTAITYDHDRRPLEEFLKASGFKVVPIEVGNDESLCNAIQASPNKFAVVSSLIDSRGVHFGRSMDVIAKLLNGIDPSQTEINRAGLDSLNGGPYGERVARVLARLATPSLTVIFSSESPRYQSGRVQFVSKGSLFRGHEESHAEIAGHLDQFFAGLENNK